MWTETRCRTVRYRLQSKIAAIGLSTLTDFPFLYYEINTCNIYALYVEESVSADQPNT
jgi:hypothetical protein